MTAKYCEGYQTPQDQDETGILRTAIRKSDLFRRHFGLVFGRFSVCPYSHRKGRQCFSQSNSLQIFDGLFKEIKRLDSAYTIDFKAKSINPTPQWCDEFFNTLEYMAFLLNHKMILKDEMHDFYKDAVLHWHRTFAENTSKKDLDNPDFFPEFKNCIAL